MVPLPNGEVQLLLIVMHRFGGGGCHQLWVRWNRGVLTGVNTGEDTPDPVAATTVH